MLLSVHSWRASHKWSCFIIYLSSVILTWPAINRLLWQNIVSIHIPALKNWEHLSTSLPVVGGNTLYNYHHPDKNVNHCITLHFTTNEIEHLGIYLLDILISSYMNCLFLSNDNFIIRLSLFWITGGRFSDSKYKKFLSYFYYKHFPNLLSYRDVFFILKV